MLWQNTQNTSKMRKSFAIDWTNRFDEVWGIFLQTAESYRKEKQMDACNSQKQMESRQRNMDLQLSFYVNMLNFEVKSYAMSCSVIYCIASSSI